MTPDHAGLARLHAEQGELFERLAGGQAPETLFIACSDSRVVPHLLAGTGPGDMFVVRNVANVVPPFADIGGHGTAAAVEFAVVVLQVRHVVVCGHSACGGVQAALGSVPDGVPHLAPWVALIGPAATPPDAAQPAAAGQRLADAVRRNVLLSLERLRGYPMVAERAEDGRVQLHGWYFDIATASVSVYDAPTDSWR